MDCDKDISCQSVPLSVHDLTQANGDNENIRVDLVDPLSSVSWTCVDMMDGLDCKRQCSGCGQQNVINKECLLQLYKNCCSISTKMCKLTCDYKHLKIVAPSRPYIVHKSGVDQ
jgi:hypothetical protein